MERSRRLHLVFAHLLIDVLVIDPSEEFLDFLVPDGEFMLISRQIVIAVAGGLPGCTKGLVIPCDPVIKKILIANGHEQIGQLHRPVKRLSCHFIQVNAHDSMGICFAVRIRNARGKSANSAVALRILKAVKQCAVAAHRQTGDIPLLRIGRNREVVFDEFRQLGVQKVVKALSQRGVQIGFVMAGECDDCDAVFLCVSLDACVALPDSVIVAVSMQQIEYGELSGQGMRVRHMQIAGRKRRESDRNIDRVTERIGIEVAMNLCHVQTSWR